MSTMRQILREVEASGTRAPVGEAVSAAVVDRMAQAMLDSTKLASLTSRAMDADQLEMFNGLILEPLRALVAKALDVAGVAVSGGLLAKAGREMKSAARGNIGVSESSDAESKLISVISSIFPDKKEGFYADAIALARDLYVDSDDKEEFLAAVAHNGKLRPLRGPKWNEAIPVWEKVWGLLNSKYRSAWMAKRGKGTDTSHFGRMD